MEFDKSRVYTALNADEVKPGSKVFVADSLAALKLKVKENVPQDLFILDKVLPEDYGFRFYVDGIDFILCYLVSEPKEPRRMTNRELARWLAQGNGQWKGTADSICTSYSYGLDDHEVPLFIKIRGWDETEWREPIIKGE